ncbi:cell division inhibitor SulA [Dickeya ananatis]
MRTQTIRSRHVCNTSRLGHNAMPQTASSGFISEIVYGDDHPMLTPLLLPLLQQLGTQSRWLLWLSPQQKLSRLWLQQTGLPLEKMIELHRINPVSTVDAMEKALMTGNYSVVLCWLPDELNNEQKNAVAKSGTARKYLWIYHASRGRNNHKTLFYTKNSLKIVSLNEY